jgi:hypothetical protein
MFILIDRKLHNNGGGFVGACPAFAAIQFAQGGQRAETA